MATDAQADTWTVARALAELPADGRREIDAGRLVMHEPPAAGAGQGYPPE